MKTKTMSNLIASSILAFVPFGALALLLPAAEVIAGLAVAAALIGLGLMELKSGAPVGFARQPKDSVELFRQMKSEA